MKVDKCSFVLSLPRSPTHPAGAQAAKKTQAKHQLSGSYNHKRVHIWLIWLTIELEMDIAKSVQLLWPWDLRDDRRSQFKFTSWQIADLSSAKMDTVILPCLYHSEEITILKSWKVVQK